MSLIRDYKRLKIFKIRQTVTLAAAVSLIWYLRQSDNFRSSSFATLASILKF